MMSLEYWSQMQEKIRYCSIPSSFTKFPDQPINKMEQNTSLLQNETRDDVKAPNHIFLSDKEKRIIRASGIFAILHMIIGITLIVFISIIYKDFICYLDICECHRLDYDES